MPCSAVTPVAVAVAVTAAAVTVTVTVFGDAITVTVEAGKHVAGSKPVTVVACTGATTTAAVVAYTGATAGVE